MEDSRPRVLLLHGLWMHAPAMHWFAGRLARHGFVPRMHGYYSLLEHTDEVVAHLAAELRAHPGTHVVAHSLGALLALQTVIEATDIMPGRIVCLGAPVAGSAAAEAVKRRVPGGARLLRPHLALLEAGIGRIPEPLQVGMIAGNRRRGLGGLFAGFACEHDGTVAVEETRVPGLAGHVVVPASHSGLIFSDAAARHAVAFLHEGRFATQLA